MFRPNLLTVNFLQCAAKKSAGPLKAQSPSDQDCRRPSEGKEVLELECYSS